MTATPPATGLSRKRENLRPFIVLGLMVVVALVAWLVLRKLQDMSRIQDCVMAGRSNCSPVETP